MTLFARFLVLQVVNIHRFPRRVGVRHQRTSRNITKHCEIMKESESSEISYDIMIYLETSWDIMTLISIFPVFWLFRDVTTINLHLETGGNAWKVRVRYIMICLETSWDIMNLISIFPVFLILQGCHYNQLTFGDGRRVKSEGQIYHDISWHISKHHEIYHDIK